MKKNKLEKNSVELRALFTPAISKILDEREAELDSGKFVEIRDLDQLRKKNRSKGSKAS